MAIQNLRSELSSVALSSYKDIFGKMKKIQDQYGDMNTGSLMSAFGSIGGFGSMYTPDPSVQNNRIKKISSYARKYKKDEIANMIEDVPGNEKPLRELEHYFENSSYPLHHMRTVYQDVLTYHWYFAPDMTEEKDSKKKDFWREYKLLNKLGKSMDLKAFAHEVAGQAWQEGKVFYHPRYMVDKVHNKVIHSFMQQLPSDWIKIVGYNNKSKYTVAFNLMYFTQDGTDYRQFGHLFEPYINDFNNVVTPAPKGLGTRLVYASESGINFEAADKYKVNADYYYQDGRWYYWVNLPVDEVFVFEIDDTSRNVVSPFAGLFLDIVQLSQLEAIQLELVQNPLISILTGEIPYFEGKDTNTSDQYKLSNAGRILFETLWYGMLEANNTSGIGLYAAPLKNMDLHTLAESPSAMDIVTKGYKDMMSKAGLSALIPTDSDAKAGAVQVSLQLEAREGHVIYACMNRMMKCIIEKLRLKYDWEFKMFGDVFADTALEERCSQAMTLGVLSDLIIYNALHDRTLLDDVTWSDMVIESNILDKRIPLVSTYNASADDNSGSKVTEKSKSEVVEYPDEGGRPPEDGMGSDGKESDADYTV